MKKIKLNKFRKRILLHMCKKLYPKFYWKPVYEGDDVDNEAYFDRTNNTINFEWIKSKDEKTTKFGCIEIHWFEFCITHLADRVFNTIKDKYFDKGVSYNSDDEKKEFLTEILIKKSIHPVDYLYDACADAALLIKKNNKQ